MTEVEIIEHPPRSKRLKRLEETIEQGLTTFVEVGSAIREIRDEKLYRDEYDTFEDYCRERWGWSKTHAYRHIEAANTLEVMSPIGDTPKNEAQTRELAPLAKEDPEAAKELWDELVAEYGEKLTAKKIKQAVAARMKRERELDQLPAEVAALIKEIDPADCDLPTSTRQLEALAQIKNKGDQLEVVHRVADGTAVSVWQAIKQLDEEGRAEIAEGIEGEDEWAVKRIVRVGAMQYVVEARNGERFTVTRNVLFGSGYQKCPACEGRGVTRKGA
jgi:hypothetical protein